MENADHDEIAVPQRERRGDVDRGNEQLEHRVIADHGHHAVSPEEVPSQEQLGLAQMEQLVEVGRSTSAAQDLRHISDDTSKCDGEHPCSRRPDAPRHEPPRQHSNRRKPEPEPGEPG